MPQSGDLPQWQDYMTRLSGAGDLVQLLVDPNDSDLRQEVYKLLFLGIGNGFMTAFADPDHPDFIPVTNSVFNASCANPDFVYYYAPVDGRGAYRMSGYRGATLFVHGDLASGGLAVMDDLGPSVGGFDLDDMQIGADGFFEILLSSEKPAGHGGNWVRLDPSAVNLVLRQASYDWGRDQDAKFAIERIDRPIAPVRRDGAEIARRLSRLADYPKRYAGLWLRYMAGLRANGFVNKLQCDDWAGRGGTAGQYYFQGVFEIPAGQALLLDTEVPESCLYWNIQLSDPLWNAIGWVDRQSSLNAKQARLDSDGRFRAVIAPTDPGVPNWLDSGGFHDGSIMLRWNRASSAPEPQLTLVPLDRLRDHLPADTPVVSQEQRQQSLRARKQAAQWRRRW